MVMRTLASPLTDLHGKELILAGFVLFPDCREAVDRFLEALTQPRLPLCRGFEVTGSFCSSCALCRVLQRSTLLVLIMRQHVDALRVCAHPTCSWRLFSSVLTLSCSARMVCVWFCSDALSALYSASSEVTRSSWASTSVAWPAMSCCNGHMIA